MLHVLIIWPDAFVSLTLWPAQVPSTTVCLCMKRRHIRPEACKKPLLTNVTYYFLIASNALVCTAACWWRNAISEAHRKWFQDLKAKNRDAFSPLYLKTFFVFDFSKNDKTRWNFTWRRNFYLFFFFVQQVKGAERGNERAKTGSIISLLAHGLIPFLQKSFKSFAEPLSALSAINLFAGSKQSSLCFLQVAGFSMSQPVHSKEKLVTTNMDKIIFWSSLISARWRWLLSSILQLETHFKSIQTQANLKFPSKSKAYENLFKSLKKQVGKTDFPLQDHLCFSSERDLNIWNTHKMPKGKLNVQFTFLVFFLLSS